MTRGEKVTGLFLPCMHLCERKAPVEIHRFSVTRIPPLFCTVHVQIQPRAKDAYFIMKSPGLIYITSKGYKNAQSKIYRCSTCLQPNEQRRWWCLHAFLIISILGIKFYTTCLHVLLSWCSEYWLRSVIHALCFRKSCKNKHLSSTENDVMPLL